MSIAVRGDHESAELVRDSPTPVRLRRRAGVPVRLKKCADRIIATHSSKHRPWLSSVFLHRCSGFIAHVTGPRSGCRLEQSSIGGWSIV